MPGVGAARSAHRLPELLRARGYSSWLDVAATWVMGAGLVLAAVLLPFFGPHLTPSRVVMTTTLLAVFIVAFRTELSHPHGATVATQPVLLALALCAPWQWMPATVATGVLLATADGGYPPGLRILWLRLGWGFSSLGLAGVVGLTGIRWDSWGWGAVGAAYLAQVGLDAGLGLIRSRVRAENLPTVARDLAMTFLIDAMLGVIGLALIGMAGGRLPGLLLLLVPVALMYLLSRDRQATYEETATLESAFTEVTAQARLDPLTGLANRRAWEEAVDDLTAPDGRPYEGRGVAVLLADLDHLKVANDTFGHEVGDRLLVELADVLRTAAPAGATVARLGGDEFGVLVACPPGAPRPDLVASARRETARRTAEARLPVPLSSSLGQSYASSTRTVLEALRDADRAARLDKLARRAQRDVTAAARHTSPGSARERVGG